MRLPFWLRRPWRTPPMPACRWVNAAELGFDGRVCPSCGAKITGTEMMDLGHKLAVGKAQQLITDRCRRGTSAGRRWWREAIVNTRGQTIRALRDAVAKFREAAR